MTQYTKLKIAYEHKDRVDTIVPGIPVLPLLIRHQSSAAGILVQLEERSPVDRPVLQDRPLEACQVAGKTHLDEVVPLGSDLVGLEAALEAALEAFHEYSLAYLEEETQVVPWEVHLVAYHCWEWVLQGHSCLEPLDQIEEALVVDLGGHLQASDQEEDQQSCVHQPRYDRRCA